MQASPHPTPLLLLMLIFTFNFCVIQAQRKYRFLFTIIFKKEPLKKNLNHFCLDCHSVCDNVYCLLTMFSALAAVYTVYCAIEIVLITLHYILL